MFPGRVDPRVGSGRVGSGRVRNIDKNGGSGRVQILAGRVGSGPSTLIRPDPPCFSKPVNVNFLTVIHNQLCVNPYSKHGTRDRRSMRRSMNASTDRHASMRRRIDIVSSQKRMPWHCVYIEVTYQSCDVFVFLRRSVARHLYMPHPTHAPRSDWPVADDIDNCRRHITRPLKN